MCSQIITEHSDRYDFVPVTANLRPSLDISQNRVYNHISDEEHVKSARDLGIGEQSTALATLSSKHQPILLKDLGVAEDRIAHYTEYGVCVHDFAASPENIVNKKHARTRLL